MKWPSHDGPHVYFFSQSWTPWRFLLSPPPVRRSSARQWRPVLLDLLRKESTINSHRVQSEEHVQHFIHQHETESFCRGRRGGSSVQSKFVHFLVCPDLTLWSEWEVNYWLDWCQAEFGLHGLGTDLRCLQGGELCGLDREAFLGLMSDRTAGEILWEHLEDMRRGKNRFFQAHSFAWNVLCKMFTHQHLNESEVYCWKSDNILAELEFTMYILTAKSLTHKSWP